MRKHILPTPCWLFEYKMLSLFYDSPSQFYVFSNKVHSLIINWFQMEDMLQHCDIKRWLWIIYFVFCTWPSILSVYVLRGVSFLIFHRSLRFFFRKLRVISRPNACIGFRNCFVCASLRILQKLHLAASTLNFCCDPVTVRCSQVA